MVLSDNRRFPLPFQAPHLDHLLRFVSGLASSNTYAAISYSAQLFAHNVRGNSPCYRAVRMTKIFFTGDRTPFPDRSESNNGAGEGQHVVFELA